jgi:nucleotide-binding universal stress UspA family protein
VFANVIIAVGGPDASLEPARVGAELAAQLSAKVTIVSVYAPTRASLGEPYYSETLIPRLAEAQATLEEAATIAREAQVAAVETVALEGDPAERISAHARQSGADLVVLGTHRRGRLGAAILGSVSAAVGARAGVPVMVVPDPTNRTA